MSTLKELTHHNHQLAEQHPFTQLLLSGKVTSGIYATYLANQLLQYQTLEHCAEHLLADLPNIERTNWILQDLLELDEPVIIFNSTANYCSYVTSLTDHQLWAHIYTKHMGDLYGGQLLKTKVPGSGTMYQFHNRQELIQTLRTKLDISMAVEANKCFELTLDLFSRIADEYNL